MLAFLMARSVDGLSFGSCYSGLSNIKEIQLIEENWMHFAPKSDNGKIC